MELRLIIKCDLYTLVHCGFVMYDKYTYRYPIILIFDISLHYTVVILKSYSYLDIGSHLYDCCTCTFVYTYIVMVIKSKILTN